MSNISVDVWRCADVQGAEQSDEERTRGKWRCTSAVGSSMRWGGTRQWREREGRRRGRNAARGSTQPTTAVEESWWEKVECMNRISGWSKRRTHNDLRAPGDAIAGKHSPDAATMSGWSEEEGRRAAPATPAGRCDEKEGCWTHAPL